MDINRVLAKELEIQVWQAEAAVKLIDEGNTPHRGRAKATLYPEKTLQYGGNQGGAAGAGQRKIRQGRCKGRRED